MMDSPRSLSLRRGNPGDILGQTGSLRGQFTGNLTYGWLEGMSTLRGYGGLENYHIIFTIVGPLGGPYDYTGDVTVDDRP
jgi:hypothetical protein